MVCAGAGTTCRLPPYSSELAASLQLMRGVSQQTMTHTRSIIFRFGDGRPSVSIHFALSEADTAILRNFLTEAGGLEAHLKRIGGLPAKFRLVGAPGGMATVSGEEPDPTAFAATLHMLRPFILEEEPFSFKRVRSILARSSPDAFLQQRLKDIKHLYFGNHLRSQIRITIGTFELTSEAALKQWLYGLEYHRDADKAVAFKQSLGPLPIGTSRPILVAQIAHKCNAILHLAHIVAKMIDESAVLPSQDLFDPKPDPAAG
jgi:hypothetical protein